MEEATRKQTSSFDDGDIAEIDSVFREEGYLAASEMIIKLEEELSVRLESKPQVLK